MFQGLRIWAILVGVALDWLLSLFLGIGTVIWIVVPWTLHHPNQPPDTEYMDRMLRADSTLIIVCIAGSLISLLPGFVTGWIAKGQRTKNAFAMGGLTAVTSCVLLPFMHGYPSWYFPILSIASVIFCGLGGFLAELAFGHPKPGGTSLTTG